MFTALENLIGNITFLVKPRGNFIKKNFLRQEEKARLLKNSRAFLFVDLIVDASNICAETDELLNEIIIAAVDVVNVADLSFTVRNESRQNDRRARSQVGGFDLTTG